MGTAGPKDLRGGKAGSEISTNRTMAGHEEKIMPMPKSGENAVNPGVGSQAGVGSGQVTKSN